MERKRVYISGQISGKEDYMIHFSNAKRYLLSTGVFTGVVNPAEVGYVLPMDFVHEEYMTVSLAILSMCDAIYMLDGWQNSEGAKEEYAMAKAKGIDIIYENDTDRVMSGDC